jgi:hypothetical protein
MRGFSKALSVLPLTGLALSLALATGLSAQSSGTGASSANTTSAQQPAATPQQPAATPQQPAATPQQPAATPQQPAATSGGGAAPASSTTAPEAKPAPGTTPVSGDIPPSATTTNAQASANSAQSTNDKKDKKNKKDKKSAPGTTAVKGDTAPKNFDPNKVVPVGGELIKVKKGSIEDVNAVGSRNIGGRGLGNWYSTDSEIKMGKQYADQIEKTTHFITDPVVDEYVNRMGQNIVKNSDCKVPFTIKVVDTDEINAFALPGGFFYVNSGLILAADEEAELAGVMAHEIAHVCAHHAAREMTRMNYAQIGTIPLIMMTGYSWTGYAIYEASSLAIPVAFLKFSRDFEAQADFLGVQYLYKAGYDPQAFIDFFEKIEALEKRKPGLVSKIFADHPQTPDRIVATQEEIEHILPPKSEYLVTTSEFNDVKARLARIENKRRLMQTRNPQKPSLRRASTSPDGSQNGQDSSNQDGSNSTDRPTLQRRDEQN